MHRRAIALAILSTLTFAAPRAHAAGAWLAGAGFTPTEQRIAVAVGPTRTTVWTSLRFTGDGGAVAIVVPAPPGASLDLSSNAWFEALEVATAPRVLPPASGDACCPGQPCAAGVLQIEGQTSHTGSLAPDDVTVLDDAAAVASWAAQAGLALAPSLQASLAELSGARFVAARFHAPPGPGVTPTLRVVMPSAPPMLPLALARAQGGDLRVTAWMIGAGRADLSGATEVTLGLPPTWRAASLTSDYDDRRAAVLASEPDRFLVEAASHEALGRTLPIAQGTATIDGLVTTFLARAAAYGDTDGDDAACLGLAGAALAGAARVAASCPRAALGVVDPAAACAESPAASEIDPGALRCGPGADDLAVALSGLSPSEVWLTRQSLVIGLGADPAVDWPLRFSAGAAMSPVVVSGSVDTSACEPASDSSTGSAGGPFFTGLGGGAPTAPSHVEAVTQDGTTSSGGSSRGSSGNACSCDSGAAGEACGNAGSEACGAVTEGACSGLAEGCGSALDNCATSRSSRPRGPKFSILLLATLAVLAPLRRRGRKARRRAG